MHPRPLPEWAPRWLCRLLGRGRLLSRTVADSLPTIRDLIRTKQRQYYEGASQTNANARRVVVAEESWWRDGRKWVHRVYEVNREANWYEETVTDPDSGAIIHNDAGPLGEHRKPRRVGPRH